jgi:glycosyltransferase involved in cell wall biosynthesis
MSDSQTFIVAVVIPCYKVKEKVMGVIGGIPPDVSHIFCVDDACPEKSGEFIRENCADPRVQVLFHEKNRGVGGAMVTGYKAALEAKADIVVKVDGDGQMDPKLVPLFAAPIQKGLCDYSKGNRFFRPDDLREMPTARLLGNGILSFLTKLSSGYWDIFDPANGYTAIHASVLREMQLDKIDPTYFFESDMLFRLNILRAVVRDVPMRAVYGGESSSLYIRRIVWSFLRKHIRNFFKRVFYNYYLHDFQIASLELFLGVLFLVFGTAWGISKWHYSATHGIEASTGTVMISVLPIVLGFQMLMSFLQFDIQSVPKNPVHRNFSDVR